MECSEDGCAHGKEEYEYSYSTASTTKQDEFKNKNGLSLPRRLIGGNETQ